MAVAISCSNQFYRRLLLQLLNTSYLVVLIADNSCNNRQSNVPVVYLLELVGSLLSSSFNCFSSFANSILMNKSLRSWNVEHLFTLTQSCGVGGASGEQPLCTHYPYLPVSPSHSSFVPQTKGIRRIISWLALISSTKWKLLLFFT